MYTEVITHKRFRKKSCMSDEKSLVLDWTIGLGRLLMVWTLARSDFSYTTVLINYLICRARNSTFIIIGVGY